MEINTQVVIDDLLEQNKQLTLQLSVARAAISQLQAQIQELTQSASSENEK